MSNSITRQFTFNFPYSDDPGYQFSLVDQEIQGIVDTINNADAGLTFWTNLKVTNAPTFSSPLTVANGGTGRSTLTSGTYLKGNGTGLVTMLAVPIPIADGGTNSIASLANGKLMTSSGGAIVEIAANVSAGSNKITSLANGTASTDAAAFGQVPVFSDWTSYTPTIAGVGTPSAVSFFYMQMGNTYYVRGIFTVGTLSGTTASITLPNSTAISSSHSATNFTMGMGERILGGASAVHAASQWVSIFYDGSDTAKMYLTNANGSSAFTKQAGNVLFASSDTCSLNFSYAI